MPKCLFKVGDLIESKVTKEMARITGITYTVGKEPEIDFKYVNNPASGNATESMLAQHWTICNPLNTTSAVVKPTPQQYSNPMSAPPSLPPGNYKTFTLPKPASSDCTHTLVWYNGFTDSFRYCSKCNKKEE